MDVKARVYRFHSRDDVLKQFWVIVTQTRLRHHVKSQFVSEMYGIWCASFEWQITVTSSLETGQDFCITEVNHWLSNSSPRIGLLSTSSNEVSLSSFFSLLGAYNKIPWRRLFEFYPKKSKKIFSLFLSTSVSQSSQKILWNMKHTVDCLNKHFSVVEVIKLPDLQKLHTKLMTFQLCCAMFVHVESASEFKLLLIRHSRKKRNGKFACL